MTTWIENKDENMNTKHIKYENHCRLTVNTRNDNDHNDTNTMNEIKVLSTNTNERICQRSNDSDEEYESEYVN